MKKGKPVCVYKSGITKFEYQTVILITNRKFDSYPFSQSALILTVSGTADVVWIGKFFTWSKSEEALRK